MIGEGPNSGLQAARLKEAVSHLILSPFQGYIHAHLSPRAYALGSILSPLRGYRE